jgi:uncharacterized protein
MPEPRQSTVRPVSLTALARSAAALPMAPLYGASLAYRAFHPRQRAQQGRPEDFGLRCTELRVPFARGNRGNRGVQSSTQDTQDDRSDLGTRGAQGSRGNRGKYVHAWLCPGSPERVVVLGHSMGMTKGRSLAHAKLLHDAGYTVCLFDHRNHGASSDDRAWVGLGDRFAGDITAVVGELRRRRGYRGARFAVYGFSFSCFSSMWALTHQGFEVDGLVCDSGPGRDVPPLLRKFHEARAVPMPTLLSREPARSVVTGVLGAVGTAMVRASWPPPATGKFARIPLLFMSGERDDIVPPSSVDALAERYPQAETHVLPGAGHLLGLATDPEAYAQVVLGFLKRTLG